jgi:hypothetical protein
VTGKASFSARAPTVIVSSISMTLLIRRLLLSRRKCR